MMTPNPVSNQRKQAKLGLAVALGALVGTGIMARMQPGSKAARMAHVAAGVALVGFSYWHVTLYDRAGGGKGRA